MTSQDLEDMKAAFLARGGAVAQAAPGIAYGVDKDADKAKRAEARQAARSAWHHAYSENEAERRMERVREAYHTGGRHAAIDAINE